VDVEQLPETETAEAPPRDSVGDALTPGNRVDHFKVIRLVGRGGMGEVYLARDTKLGRKVALKVIQPERLGSKRAVKQFLQEARATATFSHPHIVTIHTTGEHEGRPYVALEYLEGRNLRKRMEDHPPSLRETLRLGLAIAEALAEAHRRHILHRDLKPENVVLPKDGRLRVVDFGLAKLIQNQAGILDTLTPPMAHGLSASPGASPGVGPDADTASLPETQASESLAKGVRGTPEYMSPEQWRDEPVTPAIDVWALGVILYELVAGQRPYGEASFFGLAFKVGAEEPVPPLPNLNELPTDVVELIHACLAKEDKKRPSAQEVVSSLQGMIAAWGRSEGGAGEANPFRGLQPFTEEHADLFFGRDAEVNAFLERLREETVLPVVGPSGAGKSSFVQAGVVPRLREQEPWTVLQLRPGRRPFRALAHRLLAGEPRRGKNALSLPSWGARSAPSPSWSPCKQPAPSWWPS
jgi:serine/threonine protein kinase